MESVRWGFERSTEHAFLRAGKGEREGEEEDHVAGLVEQIAHAMLEEEEEERDVGGKSSPKDVWGSHSSAQASVGVWEKSDVECFGGLPAAVHKRVECEAMELLYMELVRLKMEELTVAQRQLSLYQKSLIDARHTPYSTFTSADGLSNAAARLMLADPQKHPTDSFCFQPYNVQANGGLEWVSPNLMHCQSTKQNVESSLVYPNRRYPSRSLPSLGMPTSRESGGTGVFLPRCRTGSRHMRVLESKRRTDYQCPVSVRCTKAVLPNKRKEDFARPVLQYPSYSVMQEVAPDVSLPTEWTY